MYLQPCPTPVLAPLEPRKIVDPTVECFWLEYLQKLTLYWCENELASISKNQRDGGSTENMPIRIPLDNINCSVSHLPVSSKSRRARPFRLTSDQMRGCVPFHSIKVMEVVVVLFSRGGSVSKLAHKTLMQAAGQHPVTIRHKQKVGVWPCSAAHEPSSSCTHRRPCGGRELLSSRRMGPRDGVACSYFGFVGSGRASAMGHVGKSGLAYTNWLAYMTALGPQARWVLKVCL